MSYSREYYVYILANKSRMLYGGVTNDIARRVLEHRNKVNPGFTARYKLSQLVYYEVTDDVWALVTPFP